MFYINYSKRKLCHSFQAVLSDNTIKQRLQFHALHTGITNSAGRSAEKNRKRGKGIISQFCKESHGNRYIKIEDTRLAREMVLVVRYIYYPGRVEIAFRFRREQNSRILFSYICDRWSFVRELTSQTLFVQYFKITYTERPQKFLSLISQPLVVGVRNFLKIKVQFYINCKVKIFIRSLQPYLARGENHSFVAQESKSYFCSTRIHRDDQ